MRKTTTAIGLILPVLAVMLVSGCVTGPSAGLGAGLVITDWSPDFPQVDSGEQVKLQLKVQNQGVNEAQNVRAELAGIKIEDWGTFSGFLQSEEMGTMRPYDPDTNVPGDVRTKIWTLQAPSLPRGTDFTYQPIVKVSYDYTTTAQKPITLVDVDELRRIKQQGRSLPSSAATTSAGPLSVEITAGDYVKTSDQFGTAFEGIFPVYVKITNTLWREGGTVVPEAFFGFGEGDYPIRVTVTPPSGTNFVYSGFGSNCGTEVQLELFRGEEAELVCELEVTSPPEYREEGLITVDVDYRYQIEKTTQVRVIGQ